MHTHIKHVWTCTFLACIFLRLCTHVPGSKRTQRGNKHTLMCLVSLVDFALTPFSSDKVAKGGFLTCLFQSHFFYIERLTPHLVQVPWNSLPNMRWELQYLIMWVWLKLGGSGDESLNWVSKRRPLKAAASDAGGGDPCNSQEERRRSEPPSFTPSLESASRCCAHIFLHLNRRRLWK